MFNIPGKVALVTGGTSGIGLGVVEALLKNNIKGVAIIARSQEKGKIVLQRLKEEYGDKAIFIKTDIADRIQFDNAFKRTIEVFKTLDIVINSAGIISDSNWENEIATNLIGTTTGTILALETYLPKYKVSDEAIIINVSSASGLTPTTSVPVYGATKSGIIALSRNFGTESHYQRSKVRVMVVCPGMIDTPMLELDESAHINEQYYKLSEKEFSEEIIQDVTYVTEVIIQMIKEGRNGSVWITKDKKPAYEIKIPSYAQMKK